MALAPLPNLATPAPPPRSLQVAVAVVLVAAAAWALPTTVQPGDAGELSTVMLRGGIPHPSGYPWIRILGPVARMFLALGIPPATAAALPCAVLGVAGWVLVLQATSRWFGAGPAAVAVLVAALGTPVLLHTMDAEVWGPLVGFAGLVLRVGAHAPTSAPHPSPLALGLCCGLAVSHHLTAVLLVPFVVGAAWPAATGRRDRSALFRSLARRGALGVTAAAVGLTPYLTLAVGSGGAWRWGDPRSLAGLWHHISRADYGSLQLSLHTESIPVADQWQRSIASVGGALSAGLPGGAVVGAVVLAVAVIALLRAPGRMRMPLRVGLCASALASLLALPAAFNLDPASPFAAWILERFDVLTILLFVPALAAVFSAMLARLARPRARALAAVAGILLVLQATATSAQRGVPSAHRFVQRYAVDLLRTPPPGAPAIVLGTDDHRTFPILYAQTVLGEGADVIYIDASLLSHPWYRARLRERAPWLPDVDKPLRLLGVLWQDPAHRDTPVYLANVFSRPAAGLPRVPEGALWRVVAPHDSPPSAQGVLDRHLHALARFAGVADAPGASSDPWTEDLQAAYHEGHGQLVSALRAEGRLADADALAGRLGAAPPRAAP